MREAGVAAASWLPLACDPEIHRKHETAKTIDFCFVGHVFPGPRADLLRLLAQRFRKHFIGQRFFDAMAQTYSASRAVFNRSLLNDVNMRVFEAAAGVWLVAGHQRPGRKTAKTTCSATARPLGHVRQRRGRAWWTKSLST